MSKKYIELFAGVGLIGEALQQSGWICHLANDISAKKSVLWKANNMHDAHKFRVGDVKDVIHPADFEGVDLVTASFPCVDFSTSGKCLGFSGAESKVIFEALHKIATATIKPRVLLIENVLGLISPANRIYFTELLLAVAGAGFPCIDIRIVDAINFSAQSRPRLFIIACGEDIGSHYTKQKDILACETRPLRLVRAINRAKETQCERGGSQGFLWMSIPLPPLPSGVDKILKEYTIDTVASKYYLSETLVDRFVSYMPKKHLEYARENSAKYKCYSFLTHTRYGASRSEIRREGKCYCLRTKGFLVKLIFLNDNVFRIRKLTPREYANLQGVPDFDFAGLSDSDCYKAMGDAVCVPVVAWVTKHLVNRLLNY